MNEVIQEAAPFHFLYRVLLLNILVLQAHTGLLSCGYVGFLKVES